MTIYFLNEDGGHAGSGEVADLNGLLPNVVWYRDEYCVFQGIGINNAPIYSKGKHRAIQTVPKGTYKLLEI